MAGVSNPMAVADDFRKADTNQDGVLDVNEYARMAQQQANQRQQQTKNEILYEGGTNCCSTPDRLLARMPTG
jgi:hypothetical protein